MTYFARISNCALLLVFLGLLGNGCSRRQDDAEKKRATAPTPEPPRERTTPPIKNFLANPTDNRGQLFVIRGQSAAPLAKDVYSITNMFIQTERDGSPDMIIEAPHCVYNAGAGTASSPGELYLRTADERIALQGRGFMFLQRESRLIISNEVQTAVRKRATRDGSIPTSVGSTNAEMIQIQSDRLDYRAELALFTGRVRATESEGRLACDVLAAHFGSGGSNRIERIEADGNVVFDQGTAQFTSDKATYLVQEGNEAVRLSGRATWRDKQREGTADTFVLDRAKNIVRAEGQARMKLPRQLLSQPGALTFSPATTSPTPPESDQFVELTSNSIELKLPPAEGPIERMEARDNVVIVSAADDTRMTGNRAVYDEMDGTVKLTGNPEWQSGDRLVRGNTLIFDRTNRVFSAIGNAHVRLPVAALGKSSLLPPEAAVQVVGRPAASQMIEVSSDTFEYRTNRMEFRKNVEAYVVEEQTRRAALESGELIIRIGDRLEGIAARGGVKLWQFPDPKKPETRVSKQISCESLDLTMNSEGRLASLVADQRVRAEQIVTRAGAARPVKTEATAEWVKATFAPSTSQLQQVNAERNVRLEQQGRIALGNHAVFHGNRQVLELTGEARAMTPEGRITEADLLAWDAAKEQLRVKGNFKSEWQRPRSDESGSATAPPGISP